jgi:hypothetical protein
MKIVDKPYFLLIIAVIWAVVLAELQNMAAARGMSVYVCPFFHKNLMSVHFFIKIAQIQVLVGSLYCYQCLAKMACHF